VKPWETLDRIPTPDGGELTLHRRGDELYIHLDGLELMSSRAHHSERRLAEDALAALGRRPRPRVLVGGLGMGYTARAALDALAGRPGAEVVVAEVFGAVVEWNRGPLAALAGRPLDDPRVVVEVGDVARSIAAAPGRFDAILLDVDNGPDAFTLDANRDLYTARGLEQIHRALTPGGVVAVWSGKDDPGFVRRLRRAGFTARTETVRGHRSGMGARYVLFLGVRS
jgi:spermidine synthase